MVGFEDYQAHVILPCTQRGSGSLHAAWQSRAQWPRAHERSPWAEAPSSASARLASSSALSESADGERKMKAVSCKPTFSKPAASWMHVTIQKLRMNAPTGRRASFTSLLHGHRQIQQYIPDL